MGVFLSVEGQSPREKVERIQEVCPLPAAASRVMRLCAEPEFDLLKIRAVLSTDAALTSEVMRLANSASFGARRNVTSLEQAVTMIGVTRLGQIATAMAMLGAFRSKVQDDLPFYKTPVLAGGLARTLASILGERKDAAFLVGLLSEIGGMVCAAVDAEGYLELFVQSGDFSTRFNAEKERYGRTSPQIGADVLERNDLPPVICEAVGISEGSEELPTLGRIGAFVRHAVPLICLRVPPSTQETLSDELPPLAARHGLAVGKDDLVACVLHSVDEAQVILRT